MVVLLTTASLEGQHLAKSFFNTGLLGAAGTDAAPSDDQFNRVSFLSHFEGANNGVNNVFDDSSSNNHTISNYGSPTQGSFGPFARPDGEWGVSFDGSGDYVAAATSTDWQFGSGNFTVEFWTFPLATGNWVIAHGDGTVAGSSISWQYGHGNFDFYYGSSYVQITSPTLTLNTWQHIAVVRNGATITVYKDGTSTGTANIGSNTLNTGGTTPFYIGGYPDAAGAGINGVISNVRVVKGTAVYTGNFTPSTSKLTAITNTKLLTCQSNRFVDNSSNGHTITPSGNPAVTAFGPFLTSAVYDATVNGASSQLGAVNSVEIPTGTWAQLGTGDFTWEWWIYPIAENNYQVGSGTSGQNASSTFTLGTSGKRLLLYYSIVGEEAYALQSPDSAPYYNLNEWHHLAYVRSGNDHKIYANGVLRATATRSGTMVNSTGPTVIGQFGTGSGVYGYGAEGIYSDVRLVKGTAVYSGSTYTVPTAPLTAISNTELLVNFKDGQAIDSAAQNNLTLGNDAKTSTTRAKFGNTSLYLDGTDYAIIDNSQSRAFGTGDFTVELFIWLNGSPAQFDYIFDMRSSSDLNYTWALSFNYMGSATNDELQWASNNTSPNAILRAVYPSLNQWVHIAVCRSGTTTRMFYDGTQVAINTSDSADYRNTGYQGYIGCRHSLESHIDAYMDEIRFSKFARYTSNFTAPTEPFADKGQ